MSEEDDRVARERWPGWTAGVLVDGSFSERAGHMERMLRTRRGNGDAPRRTPSLHSDGWDETGRDRSCCVATTLSPACLRAGPGVAHKITTGDERIQLLALGATPGTAHSAPAFTETGAALPG